VGNEAADILKHLRSPRSLTGIDLPSNFVLPNYDGYGLSNVPASVLDHFGAGGTGTPPLAADAIGDTLKGCRKVVVLLVDALGYLALRDQMRDDRSLGLNELRRRGRFVPLTSAFPSTTAVTTTTLHTAMTPAAHGITGYRVYMKDRGGVANMIRLSPDVDSRYSRLLRERGDARKLLGVMTVHGRLKRARIPSYCLIRREIYRSGLSEMHYGDAARVIPFISSSDMCVEIRRLVETDPTKPACIWAYWDALDTILHQYGTEGPQPQAEVRSLAYSLKKEVIDPLVKAGRGKTAVLLTADHGHVMIREEDVIQPFRSASARDHLAAPPSGTGRSLYMHVRHGRMEKLKRSLKRSLGDRAALIECEHALAEGLWGPGKPKRETPERLGDLMILPYENNLAFYPYRGRKSRTTDVTRGRHGGLHEQEMLVPLLCAKL
jgi:hypothetical protein